MINEDSTPSSPGYITNDVENEIKRVELLNMSQAVNLIGSWEWDLKTNILLWTDAMFQLRAEPVSVDHLISFENTLEFVHPDDQEMLKEKFNSLRQKEDVEFEYRVVTNEGETKIIAAWAAMFRDENGQPLYLRGTSQDVTKQREAEKKLRQTNNAFKQCEELANLGNWELNLTTDQYKYSDNLYRLLGVEPNAFQPAINSFVEFVHPDDKDKVPSNEVLNKHPEDALIGEFKVIKRGGEIRNVRSTSKLFTNLHNEKVVLGTVQDITEEVMLRRQMEEKVSLNEMIIENSVDFIAAYDKQLRVTAWNRKCEEKYGMKKEEVLGKHVTELFPVLEGEQWLSDLKRGLNGEVIHREEKTDDSFYEIFINPLRQTNGSIFGVLCISHDLTAIKNVTDKLVEVNSSLNHKNEELERSNNELASFSYVASHDLQEPLRKIQTYSNRIMEKDVATLSYQGVEYFKRMEAAAKRMEILIDDLLTFSRTNTLPKDFKEVDLNIILDDLKAELKDSIEEKKAIIESSVLPVANVIVFQFRQLLSNLLLNALKYNKPGTPPHVQINSQIVKGSDIQQDNIPAERSYHKISITDNGIGFEQQYNQKIFELFQRLHGRSEYPGTGLGLAICKKIMLNHEGFITAHGEVGKGAAFTIYLPV